jgi:asparagine synthase (glutamine-hydrolysing)
MCGIWLLLSTQNNNFSLEDYQKNFNNIVGRGPDNSILKKINNDNHIILGFHRLSINGIQLGNQPFEIETRYFKYYLICNGEIYNYSKLANEFDIELITNSDCEIILPLYIKLGINRLVNLLDGVFAFTLVEINKENNNIQMYCARDRIGVRPLFYGVSTNTQGVLMDNYIYLCSEMKGINNLSEQVYVFPPGNIMSCRINKNKVDYKFENYYNFNYIERHLEDSENDMLSLIRIYFEKSIKKRLMSDRPIGSLLSGGLDSSLVSALVSRMIRKKIKTFSICMPGGTDKHYSDMVSKYIKSDHYNIELSKEDFLNSIEETIWAIESYDITTVRASVGQFLVSKFISEETDIKVVMSGDGSDEVCSGYLYNYKAPTLKELHDEAQLRLKEIHLYDSLRADRATSYHGLELRVPFLDFEFVDMYMKINEKLRIPTKERMEKYLLRKAFESENLLPKEVLWRKKEAFSDGVSSKEESWHNTIKKYISTKITDEEFNINKHKFTHCKPETKEAYYYRKIFCEKFGDHNSNVIPKFWLPNWSEGIKEPSARALDLYENY